MQASFQQKVFEALPAAQQRIVAARIHDKHVVERNALLQEANAIIKRANEAEVAIRHDPRIKKAILDQWNKVFPRIKSLNYTIRELDAKLFDLMV
jgi:hypothetical protein